MQSVLKKLSYLSLLWCVKNDHPVWAINSLYIKREHKTERKRGYKRNNTKTRRKSRITNNTMRVRNLSLK